MAITRPRSATSRAHPVDLAPTLNASDRVLGARFHPLYRSAFTRLPGGRQVFRGLPFDLAPTAAPMRWLLLDQPLTIDLRGTGPASHVVIAHLCDAWRDERGERPPGRPVGWVMPVGEALARYELATSDGRLVSREIRRRFEINEGIIGWGSNAAAAVSHRQNEPLDWRGPHPVQRPGRYAEAGHAGPLTILPGTWGGNQTGVTDFIPSPDDEALYWLHAIDLGGAAVELEELRLTPLARGRPGSDVVVAAITLFAGTADPLVLQPRRQLLVGGLGGREPDVDLGLVIRSRPAPPLPGRPEQESVAGWGSARRDEGDEGRGRIIDVALAPDASLALDDWIVPSSALEIGATLAGDDGRMSIEPLPSPAVRLQVDLLDGATRAPIAARVRCHAADGRYLPPLGHRDEINPGINEDTGAGLVLGADTYAYVPGRFEIDVPLGQLSLEVVRGFDYRPVRTEVTIEPTSRAIAIELKRPIDLRSGGWVTADSHVHFIASATALLQAAAEDVNLVHLLATQWGDQFTSVTELPWGSNADPSGEHLVVMGTENRQNVLGHVGLLGARRPVLPMASGGPPEGRIGQALTELIADWADRCHADDGLVIAAHFPLPYAEIAADVVAGKIDAVEMQCFSPGLDHPSILEWYRFLNCGYRLPLVGGTDKMSAEVPLGAVRTYARLDPGVPLSFVSWAAAIRAGRTFATSGPVIELTVDGHEPGDVVRLPASGARLPVHARARASQPLVGAVELVVNGRVVAANPSPLPVADLAVDASIEIASGAWIAARSRSPNAIRGAFSTSMAAHSSPVYIEVPDRPLRAGPDADAIAMVIEAARTWVATTASVASPADRRRMVDFLTDTMTTFRGRFGPETGT